MQSKAVDYSKVPSFMKFLLDELEDSNWCSSIQSTITKLKEEYDINVSEHRQGQLIQHQQDPTY